MILSKLISGIAIKTMVIIGIAVVLIMPSVSFADDEEALVYSKSLTLETALKAANAAIDSCKESGYAVAVAVVDRSGLVQVVLRDDLAGLHTPDTATKKAWTAVSVRTNTSTLKGIESVQGLAFMPNMVMLGGGRFIEAGGEMVGGIGVSGAPGGDLDDVCADAGIEAILEDIEF
jgi:uncharacterized protein GlcG (DUF336 family)